MVNAIIVALTQVVFIGHAVAIVVDQFIASIDDTVLVSVHRIVSSRTQIVRVEDAVVVPVIDATISVPVPTPCILLRTCVVPLLEIVHSHQGAVDECRMVDWVVGRFENGVGRCTCSIPLGECLALHVGSFVSNRADVLPNHFTLSVDFVKRALGAVSNQDVSVGQSLCARNSVGIHCFSLVP